MCVCFSHGSGQLDVALINVDVTSVLQLSRDDAGRLQLSSAKCGAQIQRLDIRLSGVPRYSRVMGLGGVGGTLKSG